MGSAIADLKELVEWEVTEVDAISGPGADCTIFEEDCEECPECANKVIGEWNRSVQEAA